jgi:hypothetical protein
MRLIQLELKDFSLAWIKVMYGRGVLGFEPLAKSDVMKDPGFAVS